MAALSDKERAELGPRIRERRESLYGTKRAAYQDAHINPSTWDRVEAGEPVRDDILRRVVRTLWPDTDGDWRRIPSLGVVDNPTEVDHRIEGAEPDDDVSPELRALIRATIEEVLRAEHSGDDAARRNA